VELVHELAGSFRGGRWWAELAPLADAGSLPSAVTAAAGTGAAGRTLDQVLHAACAEGPVLLVLDNCEHLVAGCAEFAGRLLGAYPKLSIVATSREPLQVPGELQVRLEPLQPVPAGADDARVLESAAARLFADRAREVVYDFDAAAHAAAIARICNGLDGLPLAIELAAHQVAILAPQVQASRLADPLSWLSTQERNPLRRRSGLRAAIGWSYELLDPVERAVFRRLTVLPGGSDQVTAAVLCGGLGLDRAGLWAILAGLAGKSLLYPDPAVPGRFRILEALRAFGREQLDADGETAAVHGLLIDWLAEVHARFEPDMWSASFQRRRELLDWAEREQANAAYALQHARQAGDVRYPDLALLLSIVWNLLSEAGKALPVLMDLLAHPGLPDAAQANAHLSLCYVLRVQGDFQAARRHGQQSLDVARRTGDDRLVCRALGHLVVATAELDLDEGLQLSRELIALLRELGDSAMLSGRLEDHAWMLFLAGDIDAAQEIAEEALALDAPGPFFLHTVGAIALQTGDLRRAEECFTGALTEAGTLSLDASFQIEGLALVAVRQHRYEHALQLLAACSALRTARAIPEDPHWTPYLAEGRRVAVEALPASVAAAADELGSGLSIEETIVLALEGRLPDRHTLRAAGPLTRREMQIAELIAAGHTTKQIAARLYISPRTVGTTLARINDKLGLANRVQLAAWMTSNAPDPT
jgi:non-specific serine/threonine protein kinase